MDETGDPGSKPMHVTLVTLFPAFFDSPLSTSLLGKAIERGDIQVDRVDPREYALDKHRTVDDTPYGGGPGMVLKPEPMVAAIRHAREINPSATVLLLTPQGKPLSTADVERLAQLPGLILICGRYEGFDERIRDYVDGELSIGDYVVSGGEPAALVVLDAVARQVEGVLGNVDSRHEESFAQGLLEYPQYTRPAQFEGKSVPDILLSGDHGRIERWRRAKALQRTLRQRPELFALRDLTEDDRESLREFSPGLDAMEIGCGRKTDHSEN